MTGAQLSRELIIVRSLCFVAQADYDQRNKAVIVRLAPPIIQYLPQERWSIKFKQDEFSVGNVMKAYQVIVVDHLTKALVLAEQLLEDSALLQT